MFFLLEQETGKDVNNFHESILLFVIKAAGGVMVWEILSSHKLGLLIPIQHHLNATTYLIIAAEHVHPFMTTFCFYSNRDILSWQQIIFLVIST